jgi:pimeloyl-ACP methyl ester carboxylesterase
MRWALRIALGVVSAALVALALGYFALLRPDVPFADLERTYANTDSRFVDLPGGFHVHYRDSGNARGPTLLLIHGFAASLHTWEPWVRQLGGKYRVVRVDLPGHGLTRSKDFAPSSANYAAFVEAFVQKLALPPATVVGNSMGGNIAWLFALRHPEHVARLVLIDASGFEAYRASEVRPPLYMRVLANPSIAAALRNLDKTAIFRQTLQSAYYNSALATPLVVQRYVELSRAPGHREILDRTIAASLGGDLDGTATKARLATLRMPVLILWGDHDRLVDPADARSFSDAIPGSKLIIYRNVGHLPMEEAAVQSATDLDTWIQNSGPSH